MYKNSSIEPNWFAWLKVSQIPESQALDPSFVISLQIATVATGAVLDGFVCSCSPSTSAQLDQAAAAQVTGAAACHSCMQESCSLSSRRKIVK